MDQSLKKVLHVDPTVAFVAVALLVALTIGAVSWHVVRPPSPPPKRDPDDRRFAPRLELPLEGKDGFVKLGADGLIPIKVIAKLKNDFDENWAVYWRVTVARMFVNAQSESDHEDVWSQEYPHLAFTIQGKSDVDRHFDEKLQMPSGLYHVLIELLTTTPLPDMITRESVPGQDLVATSFYCLVP